MERIEDHWVNTLPRHHAGSRVSCNTMARIEGGGGKDRGPLGQHLAQTPRRLQGFVQHNEVVKERIEDHWVNTLQHVVEERIEDHWVNTLPRHHAGSRVSCNTMARTEGGGGGKDRGPLGQHLAQTPCRLQGFVQHVVEERIEDHWVNTLPRHYAGSRVSCNTMARTEGGGGGKDRGPLGQHLAQTPRRLQGFVQHNDQD